jgi:hypothetical protein
LPAAGDSITRYPYVLVSLRNVDETVVIDVGKTNKTLYIKNSRVDAVWKETFSTYVIDQNSFLLMEIFDWNMEIFSRKQFKNDEFMGFVSLELSEYLTESPTPVTFQIKCEIQNQDRFKGSASLSFDLEVEQVEPSVAFRKVFINQDFII